MVEGKRGSIPDQLPPILNRLKIDPEDYIRFVRGEPKSRFRPFIVSVESMRERARAF